MEVAFRDIKSMVSAKTLMNHPDWKIPFPVHTYAFDKQFGAVISQNDKAIAFFLKKGSNPHHNYTTIDKELIFILEWLNKFYGIIFGYKINVYSDHKKLVYKATYSESQKDMSWQIIL